MDAYKEEYGVSQSDLKILRQSPAHLKYARENPEPPTPAMILGTLEHYLILEPRLFAKSFYSRPETYGPDKKKWHSGSTECKAWLKAHSDKPVVSPENEDILLGMQESVRKHPAVTAALAKGLPEQCLFWEDADTGLQCKCRCDWLTGNSILDPKTCQDASPIGFGKIVANMGYDIQAAYNLDGAKALGLGKECFLFIAIESYAPYAVAVYQLDEAAIQSGREKYRRLLNRYLECVTRDEWPAYSEQIEILELPRWAITS